LAVLFLGFTILLSGGWLDRIFSSPVPAVEVSPPASDVNTVPESLPAVPALEATPAVPPP